MALLKVVGVYPAAGQQAASHHVREDDPAHLRFRAGWGRRPQIYRKRPRPDFIQPPIRATLEVLDEYAAQNITDAEVASLQGPRSYPDPQDDRFPILKQWRVKEAPYLMVLGGFLEETYQKVYG